MNEKQVGTESAGDAPESHHRFLVADGYRWTVREVAAPEFDRRAAPRHLIFDGETVVRRVRFFPAGWSELSDEALYALCWRIRPIQS